MKQIVFIAIFSFLFIACKPNMHQVEQIESFKVIGISVETTNENGKAIEDLGALWQKFFHQNVSEKVPNKLSEDVYSLYTDYETDYTGKYTAIIGLRVSSLKSIPEGMIGREFNGGVYKKFITASEESDAVVDVWKEVWAKDKELNRQYTVDFEVHKKDLPAEVYIAVKE